jgi:hypothetical protein
MSARGPRIGSIRFSVGLFAALGLVALVGTLLLVTSTSPAGGRGTPGATPSAAEVSQTIPDATRSEAPSVTTAPTQIGMTSTDAGLALTVDPDRTVVEPGGTVVFAIAIRNDRPDPVTYRYICGGPASLQGTIALPQAAAGRTWTGIKARFEAFAIENGTWPYPPGRVATEGHSGKCDGNDEDRTLKPGETMTSAIRWRAMLAKGVPAVPGHVEFEIVVDHDPVDERTLGPTPAGTPDCNVLCTIPSWSYVWSHLVVRGELTVSGTAPRLASEGQVIEAVLADTRFSRWLDEQPESTWQTANVYFDYDQAAVWNVELFRGEPRNYAIAKVDAFTGKLRSLSFCNDPCLR